MSWFGKKNETAAETPRAAPEAPVATPPPVPQEREEYVVMPKELRVGIANIKGRKPLPDDKVVGALMSEAFPITAAVQKAERVREAARQKAEAEALKNPQVGKLIAGKGIFMGLWEPKDRDGKSLGKKYNLFAAPEDMDGLDKDKKKICRTYSDAAKELSTRKNWHGHNGGNFANDTALYNALKGNGTNGEWFIPPRELVQGKDIDGNVVRKDNNLYALRDTGDFKGTFTTASGDGDAHWYWSCTERRDVSGLVYGVGFTNGGADWDRKGLFRLSSRPCRVELVI